METYFQDSVSCMGCHDIARDKKLDFVWFIYVRAFAPNDDHLIEVNKLFKQMRTTKSRKIDK
jgi:hypothetical protein